MNYGQVRLIERATEKVASWADSPGLSKKGCSDFQINRLSRCFTRLIRRPGRISPNELAFSSLDNCFLRRIGLILREQRRASAHTTHASTHITHATAAHSRDIVRPNGIQYFIHDLKLCRRSLNEEQARFSLQRNLNLGRSRIGKLNSSFQCLQQALGFDRFQDFLDGVNLSADVRRETMVP